MNPDKQVLQLPEEVQVRQPVVEFVMPHGKHSPVIVCVCPKEQETQMSDLFLYSYLHFSHPVGQAIHF